MRALYSRGRVVGGEVAGSGVADRGTVEIITAAILAAASSADDQAEFDGPDDRVARQDFPS
jgi:hypothetical protein